MRFFEETTEIPLNITGVMGKGSEQDGVIGAEIVTIEQFLSRGPGCVNDFERKPIF